MLHIVETVVWNVLRGAFGYIPKNHQVMAWAIYRPIIICAGFGVLLVLLFGLRRFLDKYLKVNWVDSDKD